MCTSKFLYIFLEVCRKNTYKQNNAWKTKIWLDLHGVATQISPLNIFNLFCMWILQKLLANYFTPDYLYKLCNLRNCIMFCPLMKCCSQLLHYALSSSLVTLIFDIRSLNSCWKVCYNNINTSALSEMDTISKRFRDI